MAELRLKKTTKHGCCDEISHYVVETELEYTDKIFLVDFKRPLAGILNLKNAKMDDEQYFAQVQADLTERTLEDVSGALQKLTNRLFEFAFPRGTSKLFGRPFEVPVVVAAMGGMPPRAVDPNQVEWLTFLYRLEEELEGDLWQTMTSGADEGAWESLLGFQGVSLAGGDQIHVTTLEQVAPFHGGQ